MRTERAHPITPQLFCAAGPRGSAVQWGRGGRGRAGWGGAPENSETSHQECKVEAKNERNTKSTARASRQLRHARALSRDDSHARECTQHGIFLPLVGEATIRQSGRGTKRSQGGWCCRKRHPHGSSLCESAHKRAA